MAVPQSVVEGVIAEGAHTRDAVTKACRAGGDCGACHGMIEDMIEEHLEGAPLSTQQGGGPGCVPCGAESGERLVPAAALARPRAA